jgi:hypothetical protein
VAGTRGRHGHAEPGQGLFKFPATFGTGLGNILLITDQNFGAPRTFYAFIFSDLSHFFSLIFSISGRISKYIDDGVHLFCKERGFPGVV